jgi:maltose alpha-D-glucosyltransferase/alpha-amylase
MLRSLDYAVGAALSREVETDRETLRPWAERWLAQMSRTLRNEYFSAMDGSGLIPPSENDRATLLETFLLDRALRELAYEHTRATGFSRVPLHAIARMLRSSSSPSPSSSSS